MAFPMILGSSKYDVPVKEIGKREVCTIPRGKKKVSQCFEGRFFKVCLTFTVGSLQGMEACSLKENYPIKRKKDSFSFCNIPL